MTTLEKMAKAMYTSNELKISVKPISWDETTEYVRLQWFALAHVAAEALKLATPAMRIAGGIAGANSEKSAETWVDIADATWNAMLDVILNEK